MKASKAFIATALVGLSLASVAVSADSVADNLGGTAQARYGTSKAYGMSYVENRTPAGQYLSTDTNFELYNYQGESSVVEASGFTRITRTWQPKADAVVFIAGQTGSTDSQGRTVYNFDYYGYGLNESTDFSSLTYVGEQVKDGIVYRFWK